MPNKIKRPPKPPQLETPQAQPASNGAPRNTRETRKVVWVNVRIPVSIIPPQDHQRVTHIDFRVGGILARTLKSVCLGCYDSAAILKRDLRGRLMDNPKMVSSPNLVMRYLMQQIQEAIDADDIDTSDVES